MKEFSNKLVMRKQSCFDFYDRDKFSLGHNNIISTTNEEADCLENVPVEVKCDVHVRYTTNILRFQDSKKSTDALCFRYIRCIEKQKEDNSITVNRL